MQCAMGINDFSMMKATSDTDKSLCKSCLQRRKDVLLQGKSCRLKSHTCGQYSEFQQIIDNECSINTTYVTKIKMFPEKKRIIMTFQGLFLCFIFSATLLPQGM